MSRMAELHADVTAMLQETSAMQLVADRLQAETRAFTEAVAARCDAQHTQQLHDTAAITRLLRDAA